MVTVLHVTDCVGLPWRAQSVVVPFSSLVLCSLGAEFWHGDICRSLSSFCCQLLPSTLCARRLGHGKGEQVVLRTKVGVRSLSPSLWPLCLNILLISADQLFICWLHFNSLVFIPLILSWQACVCVKALSQDWANGSRSACKPGVCQGDLHFEDRVNPFSMVRTRRQLPQKRFALSSPLASPLMGISEQRGQQVRAGSTNLVHNRPGSSSLLPHNLPRWPWISLTDYMYTAYAG